jgi:hypothetical protein
MLRSRQRLRKHKALCHETCECAARGRAARLTTYPQQGTKKGCTRAECWSEHAECEVYGQAIVTERAFEVRRRVIGDGKTRSRARADEYTANALQRRVIAPHAAQPHPSAQLDLYVFSLYDETMRLNGHYDARPEHLAQFVAQAPPPAARRPPAAATQRTRCTFAGRLIFSLHSHGAWVPDGLLGGEGDVAPRAGHPQQARGHLRADTAGGRSPPPA